ncbi:MAG: sulfite exporter TauE/SafE family protein [Hyphomicrobiales bacterium]|nr:sulfite exporter TauE/SafE family protein [Hyphomicrobiales bacterium]
MHFEPLYAASGAAVGFIVGLTGVGGGSLMTPLLVLLFGVHPATAVGTDLLYAAVTKSAGSLVHNLDDNVDWRVVRRLAAGSAPAAAATILFMSRAGIDSSHMSRLIGLVLGVALLLTSGSILARPLLLRLRERRGEMSDRALCAATVALGAVIGVLVSISSVGAGAIGVTALLLLYPRMSTVRIVGTDVAHAVPLTLIAGLGHWIVGSVDPSMLLSLLTGSIPGIVLGARLAPRVREPALRFLLAAVLILVGGRMVAV